MLQLLCSADNWGRFSFVLFFPCFISSINSLKAALPTNFNLKFALRNDKCYVPHNSALETNISQD